MIELTERRNLCGPELTLIRRFLTRKDAQAAARSVGWSPTRNVVELSTRYQGFFALCVPGYLYTMVLDRAEVAALQAARAEGRDAPVLDDHGARRVGQDESIAEEVEKLK